MIEEIINNISIRDSLVISFIMIIANVVFDELQQHSEENKWKFKNKKLNDWLNEKTSWRNKHNWKPSWFFKTAGVFLTDGEHFFQMLKRICILIIPCLFVNFYILPVLFLFQMLMSGFMNEKVLKK